MNNNKSNVKRAFRGITRMANTIGAVNCSNVRIKASSPDCIQFMSWKNYRPISVQVICDSDCNILSVKVHTTPSFHTTAQWEFVWRQEHLLMSAIKLKHSIPFAKRVIFYFV